jgi:hypothetical protein
VKNRPNPLKQHSEILTGTPMRKKLQDSEMKREREEKWRGFGEWKERERGCLIVCRINQRGRAKGIHNLKSESDFSTDIDENKLYDNDDSNSGGHFIVEDRYVQNSVESAKHRYGSQCRHTRVQWSGFALSYTYDLCAKQKRGHTIKLRYAFTVSNVTYLCEAEYLFFTVLFFFQKETYLFVPFASLLMLEFSRWVMCLHFALYVSAC